jgi:hypothetical protein
VEFNIYLKIIIIAGAINDPLKLFSFCLWQVILLKKKKSGLGHSSTGRAPAPQTNKFLS